MSEPTVEERIMDLLEPEVEATNAPEEAEEAVQDDEIDEAPPTTSEAEEEPEEAQAEPEDDVEEIQITSLAEWAEHDGIGIEDAYSITLPVQDSDGTVKQVPIGELKDSYQNSTAVRAVKEKLARQAQEFEAHSAKRKEELDQHFFTAAKMVESIERSVLGELNTPQIQELRQSDPAEYAAILAEHQERTNSVASMKQELANEYAQHRNRQAEERKAKQAEYLQKAYVVLPQLIPEWTDERTAKQEAPMIREYGTQTGFAEQELAQIVDPRLIKVFRDATLYNKQRKAAPEIKKKVRSINSKVLKSGKSKSKTDRKADAFKVERRKLKASGSVQDAADLFEKHFLGDF